MAKLETKKKPVRGHFQTPIPNVQYAMLSDPEEAEKHLPYALPCVDFRHVQLHRPSHFSTYEAQSL